MPKGQKPYKPLRKQSILGTVPASGELRASDHARHPMDQRFTTKPRPAIERGKYLDEKIDEMSK